MPSPKEVNRALARIRAAMPAEKKVATTHRNIRLGLERISRVVPDEQSWVGIHVGGTNGKGSICNLLAGLFKLAGLSHGMYTSPAMPERHNGVTINGLYINKRMYEMEISHIEEKFRRISSGWRFAEGEDPGKLTPFELETAAAFRVFNKMHVKYGIVEVGMGGATDATNAMRQKSVTVISKIDLDHQEYLGNTIEEIAKVKAGIMRPGVPCIVDHTNPSSVIKVLRQHAKSIGTQISASWKGTPLLSTLDTDRFKLEEYEVQNLLCATLAFRHLFPSLDIDINKLLSMNPFPPGRKEPVGVLGLTGGAREQPILVDGAHNLLGAQALASYVQNQVRQDNEPVSWVIGMSASTSKPFAKIIETLVRPQDNFAFVEYLPGLNEPPPAPAELGTEIGKSVVSSENQVYNGEPTIQSAVKWACDKAGTGPVVVTGSLYMIKNFFMLPGIERKRQQKTRRPGRSQLWHYIQLSQKRNLTPEEEREFKQARRHWHLSPVRNSTFSPLSIREKAKSQPVPERTRNLQRQVDFHRKQADGYRAALKSAEKDLEKEPTESEAARELRGNVDQLKRRRDEHLKIYSSSMFKLRGYVAAREKKFMSHQEVFGRPEGVKKKAFPFPDEVLESSDETLRNEASASLDFGDEIGPGRQNSLLDNTQQEPPQEGISLEALESRLEKRNFRRSAESKRRAMGEAENLVGKLAGDKP